MIEIEIDGTDYWFPEEGDENWGSDVTAWAQAVAQYFAKVVENPMTASGDIIYGGASGTPTKLVKGSDGQYLKLDSGVPSWATLAGSGDVVGPALATNNAIARFDLTTGKLLQNSAISIDDNGHLIPDITQVQDLGDDTYRFGWAKTSCTRTGADGGISVYNTTDSQEQQMRFAGNNIFNIGSIPVKLYPYSCVGNWVPNSDQAYELGGSAANWEELWLDDGATHGGKINFDNAAASITSAIDHSALTFANFTRVVLAAELGITLYSQDAEPTLTADNMLALWKDTDDSNKIYLVFRRGSGDQVKVQLA